MCRKVHVEEPRRSTSGGQSAGRERAGLSDDEEGFAEGLGRGELVLLLLLLLLLTLAAVDEAEDGGVREDCCFIMAVHAADEVQDRQLE